MSKALKWLEAESDRLEKECNENNDPHKTINHSFLEGFNYALLNAQALEQIQLDDNQKVVLEQLKINAGSNGSLIKAIHSLYNLLAISSNRLEKDGARGLLKAKNALARLTRKQAAEVLAAFTQWGLKQEEAE